MSRIDQLLVIWGEPAAGRRHVIGHLERAEGEFRFWYEDDLAVAFQRGFRLLPELPEHRRRDGAYVARYLFPLFAERIPALSRRDAKSMMDGWGVEWPDDQFEVLAKSGGIRATDRLEVAEYRAPDDELTRPLEFRVAGRRYMDDPAPLVLNDTVGLRRQPGNLAHPAAVIVDRDGKRAGYVPRQYTAIVGGLLDLGVVLKGQVVRQLIVPEDVGKWVVRVMRVPPCCE